MKERTHATHPETSVVQRPFRRVPVDCSQWRNGQRQQCQHIDPTFSQRHAQHPTAGLGLSRSACCLHVAVDEEIRFFARSSLPFWKRRCATDEKRRRLRQALGDAGPSTRQDGSILLKNGSHPARPCLSQAMSKKEQFCGVPSGAYHTM